MNTCNNGQYIDALNMSSFILATNQTELGFLKGRQARVH